MKNFIKKIKQFWKEHPQWSSVLIAIFSFIFLQIASGVISNSAYFWYEEKFVPWSAQPITINNLLLLGIAFTVFFIGIVGWAIGKANNTQLSQATLQNTTITSDL